MKIDLKKELPAYAARRGEFSIVQVPPQQYLMVDGQGDPNTATEYADAVRSLYPLVYALKFLSKNELGRDHVVMPLEGLWWAEDMSAFTTRRDKSAWSWTMMIGVPGWISAEHVDTARRTVAGKSSPPPRLRDLRFEMLDEGTCVQTLHIGSYDDEAPVLDAMHSEFIPAHGMRMGGKHHEIYLSDPRRTAPQRLRTILRQPITYDAGS